MKLCQSWLQLTLMALVWACGDWGMNYVYDALRAQAEGGVGVLASQDSVSTYCVQ